MYIYTHIHTHTYVRWQAQLPVSRAGKPREMVAEADAWGFNMGLSENWAPYFGVLIIILLFRVVY